MIEDDRIWRRLPRALGAAATGLLVAALLAFAFQIPNPWAAAAGVLATALLGLAPLSRRQRPDAVRAQESDGMLASFPPLAREVFENLPDPLMLLDRAGRVLFANR